MSVARPTALVTAGGTVENVDDVRVLGNLSKGAFGVEIARALAQRGFETTLLGSVDCVDRLGRREPFDAEKFRSYASLREVLFGMIESQAPSILLMAAAVSDYTPVPASGKIRSDRDRLVIECTRNPKLLSELRPRCGVETFLVGFKLLSGVTDRELVATALRQVRADRLNLTVANDMQHIDFAKGIHPVVLVTPEGGAIHLGGSRAAVARDLVDFCMRRRDVHWFKTTMVRGVTLDGGAAQDLAASLLETAQDAQLLIDTNGNVSACADERREQPSFWVTPRQTDKDVIGWSDLTRVEVNPIARAITCRSEQKSSIDAGMQAVLYRHLPGIEALLHFHPGEALLIPQAKTDFPFPCGTLEEADEILHAISKARMEKRYQGGPFLLELSHHGYLLGLDQGGVARLAAQWRAVKEGYARHLAAIEEPSLMTELSLTPVFVGPEAAGVVGKHPDGWRTLWLDETRRKHGHGEAFVSEMIERGHVIGAHDACGVTDYYLGHGYRILERAGKFVTLLPPSRREDLRAAVSIALVNPETREVLMGERRCEPYLGFYSFPGGGIEAGESPFEAAKREFVEETGHALELGKPVDQSVQYAGWRQGERAYRINNFVLFTGNRFQENTTDELRCRWVPLDERVKAFATKAVLRRIRALLPE